MFTDIGLFSQHAALLRCFDNDIIRMTLKKLQPIEPSEAIHNFSRAPSKF